MSNTALHFNRVKINAAEKLANKKKVNQIYTYSVYDGSSLLITKRRITTSRTLVQL